MVGALSVAVGRLVMGAAAFSIKPDPSAPGVAQIQKATNIGAEYALLGAGLGLVLCVAAIAVSKGLHLERLHQRGKEGVIVALGAAFVIGLATALLNAAYTM
jgi:hypothetical protein